MRRTPDYEVKTFRRPRPENVKERIVEEREFKTIHLQQEHVAEFSYRPTKCRMDHRVDIDWKDLELTQRQRKLFDYDCRFHITNDWESSAEEIRC